MMKIYLQFYHKRTAKGNYPVKNENVSEKFHFYRILYINRQTIMPGAEGVPWGQAPPHKP